MRELTMNEMSLVAGAGDECSSGDSGLGGIAEPSTFGEDLISIYEGAVAAVSHVIERVANSL